MPTPSPLQIVGIDDFSLGGVNRRGGTILVDLERHRVVDLLGESTTTAATAWLRTQPQIAILSRDRGESYMEAARLAAPQAIQVADRWHLLHNLSEVTQAVLERHRLDLRKVAQAVAQKRSPPDGPTSGAPVARAAPEEAQAILAYSSIPTATKATTAALRPDETACRSRLE